MPFYAGSIAAGANQGQQQYQDSVIRDLQIQQYKKQLADAMAQQKSQGALGAFLKNADMSQYMSAPPQQAPQLPPPPQQGQPSGAPQAAMPPQGAPGQIPPLPPSTAPQPGGGPMPQRPIQTPQGMMPQRQMGPPQGGPAIPPMPGTASKPAQPPQPAPYMQPRPMPQGQPQAQGPGAIPAPPQQAQPAPQLPPQPPASPADKAESAMSQQLNPLKMVQDMVKQGVSPEMALAQVEKIQHILTPEGKMTLDLMKLQIQGQQTQIKQQNETRLETQDAQKKVMDGFKADLWRAEETKDLAQAKKAGRSGAAAGSGAASYGGLNDATMKLYVGTAITDPRGLNSIPAKVRTAVVNYAANVLGITGEDVATGRAQAKFDQAAATSSGHRAGQMEAVEQTIPGLIDAAKEASHAVPRGKFVPLNKLMQTADSAISDPDLLDFKIANQAVVSEYQQVISRGGTNVTALKEALELLQTAPSQEAYDRALDRINKEVQINVEGSQKARAALGPKGSKTGAPAASGSAPPPPPSGYTPVN